MVKEDVIVEELNEQEIDAVAGGGDGHQSGVRG